MRPTALSSRLRGTRLRVAGILPFAEKRWIGSESSSERQDPGWANPDEERNVWILFLLLMEKLVMMRCPMSPGPSRWLGTKGMDLDLHAPSVLDGLQG